MTIVAEVLTASGILAVIGLILRWLWARINKMESKHCDALYTKGHQPRYVTTDHCEDVQDRFSSKFDELKIMLKDMDKRREEAKDQFAEGQRKIESRLTAIETQLKMAPA